MEITSSISLHVTGRRQKLLSFFRDKYESGNLVAGGIDLASLPPMLAKKSLKASAE